MYAVHTLLQLAAETFSDFLPLFSKADFPRKHCRCGHEALPKLRRKGGN